MIRELVMLASAEGGEFNPLSLNFGAVLLTWITFIVSLIILTKACWKPILQSAREREDRIADNIKSAEQAKSEAEDMLKKYQSQLDGAKQEVASLIEQGRTSAEKLKKEILDKAGTEAESARNRANKEIELATEKALEQIRAEAIDLSITVASRIIERSLDDADHRKMAQDILEEVK